MSQVDRPAEVLSDAFIGEVVARARGDERVRRSLPGGGRIHLDRRLPFLCVYRRPAGQDEGTQQLVTCEAASVVALGDARSARRAGALVRELAGALSEHFSAFLIVEVWAASDDALADSFHAASGEPIPPRPAFKIVTRGVHHPDDTVETLARSLRRIRALRRTAEVAVDRDGAVHPPGMKPLIAASEARRRSCYLLGLEVRPVYRDAGTGQVYPAVLRSLRRQTDRALRQAFFAFAMRHTRVRPQHYYSLGRRSVVKAVWEVDQRLAEIDGSFDLLLQATPVNVEGAWSEFRRSRYEKAPRFLYRPVTEEPALLKRRLYEIPIEKIEDPTLAHMFREKQDELDRRITMLADVGTPRFLAGSFQVHGAVEPSLLELAERLLEAISPRSRDQGSGRPLEAAEFARRAEEELAHYRSQHAAFGASVTIRDDLYSGLLVSRGHLLVGRRTRVPRSRVEALLQHEVGTHLVTFYNGRAQPFRQLEAGLAGYDGLQEGLAVLAEYLVGGLSRPRIRYLAARVAAVARLVQGASFVETFRWLNARAGFSRRSAYTITMRVYRGGGLTKDAVYLRGLVEILEYLRRGGELEPLLVGKIAADHVPLIRELQLRQVLHAPPWRPRYMGNPQTAERLRPLRDGRTVLQLVEGKADENRIRRQRREDRAGGLHDHPPGDDRRQSGA